MKKEAIAERDRNSIMRWIKEAQNEKMIESQQYQEDHQEVVVNQ